MARASHSADTSPVLPSSCLVSFHLISPIPLLSLLSLLSTAHRCLCSAQQFGTFRVTVSRLFCHLRAIIYHLRVAHTHTHTHTHYHRDFHSAFVMWISLPEESLTTWIHPALITMKHEQMSHTALSLLFFFSFSFFFLGWRILASSWQIWNNISYKTRWIYLHLDKKPHIFVPSTD